MADTSDRPILGRATCLRLLATCTLGRVVLSVETMPSIQPVNFTVDGESIYFRTTPDKGPDWAQRGDIVAFQVDNLHDDGKEASWTVTVIGHAEVINDPRDIVAPTVELPMTWNPRETTHLIRICIETVHGNRLGGRAPR